MKKRLCVGFILMIAVASLALQGCDLSALLGSEEKSEEGSEPEPEVAIESYILKSDDNPSLVFTVIGEVRETEVRLVLDHEDVVNDVKLIPTVKVSDGATYTPQGPIGFKNDNFYVVTGSSGLTRGYNVYADVDPNTVP